MMSAQEVEDLRVDVVARRLEPFAEARPDPRRDEAPGDHPISIDAVALELEYLLEHDRVALHSGDLADAGDLARPVREAGGMDDTVDRRADLLTHGTRRDRDTRHLQHHLESADAVPGGVRVHGGDGPIVPSVHRLEHIEDLGAADLAHDDAVRPHAEAVPDQVTLGDLTAPLDVRRPRLQPTHVRLLELELRR